MIDIHPEAERLVKLSETKRLAAYLCPAGVPTIGYGHTRGVELGQTCTDEQAEEFFREDYAEALGAVLELLPGVDLTAAMKAALVSLVFNIGRGNFASSTLRRRLVAGEYQLAADEFKRWSKGRHPKTRQLVVLRGLVERRAAERALFLSDGVPAARAPRGAAI